MRDLAVRYLLNFNKDKKMKEIKENKNGIAFWENPLQFYETNSIAKKFLNFFLVPILNILPSSFNKIIKKTNREADKLIKTATSYHAIEILYNYNPHRIKNPIQRFFYYIWFNLNNPKAVRNRLKLVTHEVRNALLQFNRNNNDIHILSIASGSARAIVDALLATEKVDHLKLTDNNVHITFLDKNSRACEYSKNLIQKQEWEKKYNFRWINDTASSFPLHFKNNGWKMPDIVEMVGLLDYFPNEQFVKIISLIYEHLQINGILITANIEDNRERRFITNVIGWKMVYRNSKEFVELMIRAGFKKENIKIVYEPLKIHFVVIAKK